MDNDILRIVTANWVLTLDGPALRNGAVALHTGRIKDVGELETLISRYPGAAIERYSGVFMPPLINAHMHLELSHLPAESPLDENETFTDWVEALIEKRGEHNFSETEVARAATLQIQRQFDLGVVFIGDIGNDPNPHFLQTKDSQLPKVYHMLELLGSTKKAQEISLERLEGLNRTTPAVAHAPYSTRTELLGKIKKRCVELDHVFSIHTAENAEEKDFIRSQSGQFYEFLKKRGLWDGDFFEMASTCESTIDYFSALNLLDEQTLLVHCVHLSDRDLQVIKDSGAHICVCPGSNAFLHSGVATIDRMINHGILPAIGTDSVASNMCLDLWVEMQRIQTEQPTVKVLDILKMVTQAGAKAFGQSQDYGSLSIGKKAAFLHVFSAEISNCITESDLLNMLVRSGRPEKIEWIQQLLWNSRSN